MKKIISIVLVITIMLCLIPLNSLSASADNSSVNFKYTINNGCITITDCIMSGKEIVIPSSIESYPVTSIGYEAFKNCSSHKQIILPNTISNIEDGAFMYCGSLTSIIIPDGVTNIKNYTFYHCGSLTNITLPNNITKIGLAAFWGCDSLENITIPENVTTIGGQAFEYCESLTSITIPNKVVDIRNYAFRNCYNLTNIHISNSVSLIGMGAFLNCENLTDVYYYGTEAEWKKITIESDNENLTSANIHFLYGHEHSFGEWIERTSLTCTTNGEKYRICSSCGEVETRITAAEGHIYNSVITSPTCLKDGYTTHTCQNCDDSYTDTHTSALGHSFGKWTVRTPVTCTENGEEYRICSNCNEEEVHIITSVGHDFNTEYTIDKYPTDSENGSKSRHCKKCNEVTDITEIQGRITEYRYKDKEVTTSEVQLGAPWILYNTSLEEKPTGSLQYKYVKYYDWDDFDYVSFNEKYIVQTYYRACRYVAADGPLTTKYFRQSQHDCATQIAINGKTFYHYGNCYNGYDDEYYCIEYYEKSEYTCYSYYKWTDWSEWSAEYISATDNKIVETRIHYTDITLANEEVNSLRLGLLYETTDESMDCNNDGIVDLLDLVLMHNARESVKTSNNANTQESQNEPLEENVQTSEVTYYDEKLRQII